MIDRVLGWFGFRRQHSRWCLENENTQLRTELRHVCVNLEETRKDRDYWKTRAELFIDRGLAKVGLVHEPVMTGPKDVPLDPFANNPFAGAGLTEFNSTKQ